MIKNYTEEEEMQIKELARRIDTGTNMLGEWLSQYFKLHVEEDFPGENEFYGPDFVRMLGYLWALQNDLYAVEMMAGCIAGEGMVQQKAMSQGLKDLLNLKSQQKRPLCVVHCGSTKRAMQYFEEYRLKDTLEGMKVLTVGASKSDEKLGITLEQAKKLDVLHLFKIDDADLVRIFNVKGYIGPSTRRELEYARLLGKEIWFLEPEEPQQQDNASLSEPSKQSETTPDNEDNDDSDDFDADKEVIAFMMRHYSEKFKEQ
jgi:hypothetical protein